MQINYLTIYFKGMYSLLSATTLLVNLSYTSQCMYNIYMKVGIQLCLEKRTIRSDRTEARAFFCFTAHVTKKVCIYVFVFCQGFEILCGTYFSRGLLSYLFTITCWSTNPEKILASLKKIVTIQQKPSSHCQMALACKFNIQSKVIFAMTRWFLWKTSV